MDTTTRLGRPRNPDANRAVIDAVVSLINEGATLNGLSLVAIARRAGVSRNSLYRRWTTKDDLYLEVLGSLNRPLPEPSAESARDDLERLLGVLIERVQDRRATRIHRNLIAESERYPELRRRYFREIVAPRRAAIEQAILRGVASGEIRSDVDVDFFAHLLVSPVLLRASSDTIDELDPITTSQRIVNALFDGVASRPRT